MTPIAANADNVVKRIHWQHRRRCPFCFLDEAGLSVHMNIPKQIMSTPLNVDWPAVRVLAVAVGVREATRQMGISQDAVRQRSKREGSIASPKSDSSTSTGKACHQRVTKCLSRAHALANVFSERKHRTKLGLSKYAAEAAERAGESDGDLTLSRKVRDVAAVHSTLWPEDHNERGILNVGILTGAIPVYDAKTGEVVSGSGCKRKELP